MKAYLIHHNLWKVKNSMQTKEILKSNNFKHDLQTGKILENCSQE